LIRRCAVHERAGILAAVSSALGGTPPATSRINSLIEWHQAAEAALLAKLGNVTPAIDIGKARQHFSYVIHVEGGQRLKTGKLIQILNEVNAEVHDLVNTGWSMFYIFTKTSIAPYWTSYKTSEDEEEDILELSLVDQSIETGGLDFWRVSPEGKASLIREYWEDTIGSQRGFEPYAVIDPDLVGRSLAEFVRHARGFAARYEFATEVSFRCEWHGLAGRHPRRLHGYHFNLGRTTKSDHRVSNGSWSIGELTTSWPEIVAHLAEPVARAFGLEDQFDPAGLRSQVDRWRRL
jgi:hypothetical protein